MVVRKSALSTPVVLVASVTRLVRYLQPLLSRNGRGYASHGDDDLCLGVSFSHVLESVGDFAQFVTPVYDRCHSFGLEKLSQDHHVRLVELRDEENDLLAATQSHRPRSPVSH